MRGTGWRVRPTAVEKSTPLSLWRRGAHGKELLAIASTSLEGKSAEV